MLRLQPRGHVGQWHQIVLHGAGGSGRRRLAGQAGVDHGAERVQIGPRSLAQVGHLGVLLDRGVVRLEDGGQRLRAVADDLPRGAEVQQHRPAVAQQQDVVRGDIAVEDLLAVQRLQRPQQRHQHPHQPGLGGRAGQLLQRLRQRLAGVERHHHVGRAIALPEAEDLDQRRVVEARQHLRFQHEAAPAGLEGLGVGAPAGLHLPAHGARGEQPRHVFLDRHLPLQIMVEGAVDDAEAADAHQAADLEFTQPGADAQGAVFFHGVVSRWEVGEGKLGQRAGLPVQDSPMCRGCLVTLVCMTFVDCRPPLRGQHWRCEFRSDPHPEEKCDC